MKAAADWRCEECGQICRRSGETLEAFCTRRRRENEGTADVLTHPQRYTLTVAHLDHNPAHPEARLQALCAPCHLRYDAPMHHTRRRANALRRRGQLTITEAEG